MEKIEWVDGIRVYCEVLIETNNKLLKLVSIDCIDSRIDMEKLFLDISQNIIRLIPCVISEETKKVILIKSDGILDFISDFDFLEAEYNNLVLTSQDILYNIKKIRNKTEHVPHKLKAKGFTSGNNSFSTADFNYNQEKLSVNTKDIIKIIKNLNQIFSKIIKQLKDFRFSLTEEKRDHPYLMKYTELNFERYNKILDSEMLYDISKITQGI